MNRLTTAFAAASLALASSFAFAQAPTPGRPGGPGGERHGQMREAYKAAHEACKSAPDRRACMTQQMCAKSPDPAKCQEHAKERQSRMSQHMDKKQQMHEACNGKRGEELGKCLHEQREKMHGGRPEKKG